MRRYCGDGELDHQILMHLQISTPLRIRYVTYCHAEKVDPVILTVLRVFNTPEHDNVVYVIRFLHVESTDLVILMD
jgi:hypothetical protein